jgi:hypothetical protein
MTEKGSTSCYEDYSGCSPSRYGGRLRGIEMVFAADCHAAVSAPSSLAPVSDPTTQPSMALSIVAGVEYFGSTMTVHPPCINTCLAPLASPSLRIIYTPPCHYICCCRWLRRRYLRLFILFVLTSLASPPPRISSTPQWIARVAGNQRGDGVPNVFPPWPGCLSLRACMCTDEAPSTPASYTMTCSPSRLPPMCAWLP